MEEVFRKWSGGVVDGTDKNTIHSYLGTYEKVFSPRRADKIRLLEIGIFSGASLLAWADYFSHTETQIVGVDITTAKICFPMDNPKVQMHIFDATIKENVDKIDGSFDFIIDDGSHLVAHQMRSFELLKDRLNPGGVYIIEDVQGLDDASMIMTLADENGWKAELVDTRHIKGRYDDLMIVIKNKE